MCSMVLNFGIRAKWANGKGSLLMAIRWYEQSYGIK